MSVLLIYSSFWIENPYTSVYLLVYCKLSISRIWRNPFKLQRSAKSKSSLIDILLACLNEEEISFLIPCAINFNNQSFIEYARFVRKINHKYCIDYIEAWLNSTDEPFDYHYDCKVQKLINVIYHKIMQQGSNLQELKLGIPLIKFSHTFQKLSFLQLISLGLQI